MNIEITELIANQAKTVAVMFCGGVLIESLWLVKRRVQAIAEKQVPADRRAKAGRYLRRAGAKGAEASILRLTRERNAKGASQHFAWRFSWLLTELVFWAASAAALSMFLYYCSYGKITFHGCLGFLAGLLCQPFLKMS